MGTKKFPMVRVWKICALRAVAYFKDQYLAKVKIALETAVEPKIHLESVAEPKITPEPIAVAESKIALEPVRELKIKPEPMAQPNI
ncbi:unnamed protein product [Prunus armeniaca]|uniref:Uncharacterized protein n=1 Tax=Prunus armeniaca TaxID=36596 RepID=A0A6J5TV54_PRUAR|nr:unnamed protein product [Prunus armeniaca]